MQIGLFQEFPQKAPFFAYFMEFSLFGRKQRVKILLPAQFFQVSDHFY